VKASQFDLRTSSVDERFSALAKQLSSLEVQLQGIESRIVGTEFYLADVPHTPEQQPGIDAYHAELQAQRSAIVGHREQLAGLKQELEISRLQVGVGDATYARDDELRAQYASLVQRERELLNGLGARDNPQASALFRRVETAEATLDARDRSIDAVVNERASEMQRVMTEEDGKLVGYREALAQLNTETEDVVGHISYQNYRRVQKRFYDVVLKADVGVIDVGWAEREEHRTRIEALTRERARSAAALDDEFREIMDDRGKQ